MHNIEPYFNWRIFYTAEDDEESPFYGREYNEFYFNNSVYDHYIHPQWDEIGSQTLYLKILFVDYETQFAVIEMIGEWNDAIGNDIMFLKREVIDFMIESGIQKFVLIGENVLNFHYDGEDYYEEWFQEAEDGWIVAMNFQPHVLQEFKQYNIDYFFNFGGELDDFNWRTQEPTDLYRRLEGILSRRLGMSSLD